MVYIGKFRRSLLPLICVTGIMAWTITHLCFCWRQSLEGAFCDKPSPPDRVSQKLERCIKAQRLRWQQLREQDLVKAADGYEMERATALLNQGVNPNAYAKWDWGPGYTMPLGAAVAHGDVAMAELLLKRGADVNERVDSSEGAPLKGAVSARNIPMIKLLLKYHADVNAPDAHSYTPLLQAEEYGTPKIVRMLRQAEIQK